MRISDWSSDVCSSDLYENLNHFLHDPRDFAPGTKMTFRGFSKPEDVANVVAYLRTLSGSPAPLPEVTDAPAPAGDAEGQPAESPPDRPEASRVGPECVRTVRHGVSPDA